MAAEPSGGREDKPASTAPGSPAGAESGSVASELSAFVRPSTVSAFGVPVVSVVTATINERANLPTFLDAIGRLPLPSYEVIVVDDGSTDGTREYLRGMAREDSRVRPIFNGGRQSLLRAHIQGIEAARGQFVVVMDADLQHPVETVPRIIDLLRSGAGLVIASRYAPGGSDGERSPYRLLVSLGAHFLLKALVSPSRSVSDPMSGFFGFQRPMFVPPDPRWRGFKLLPFLVVSCPQSLVREIPYSFRCRANGESKIVGSDLKFVRVYLTEILLVGRFAHQANFHFELAHFPLWSSQQSPSKSPGSRR